MSKPFTIITFFQAGTRTTQRINQLKKLKINYLFIGILALLLAVALWPSIPWFGKADNRIAAIQARGELRVSTIHTPGLINEINGKPLAWITNWRNSLPITSA